MAVKVTRTDLADINHPAGSHITIQDGHLFVTTSEYESDTVAIYTPKSWLYASVISS